MSINVTVTGNPVSIRRGKMVTIDSDKTRTEFDKRRRLRLEQVRQQSRDIAEDVRNKVKKEKKRQLGKCEEEGREELMQMQNRKLLELQNQYREALKDLGKGHKAAAEEIERQEEEISKKQSERDIAVKRGCEAKAKVEAQKTRQNVHKSKLKDRKKLVRELENNRALLVSNLPNISKQKETKVTTKSPKKGFVKPKNKQNKHVKKKQKVSATNVNITIPGSESGDEDESREKSAEESSEEEESSSLEEMVDSRKETEESEESQGYCGCSDSSGKPRTPPKPTKVDSFHDSSKYKQKPFQFDPPPKETVPLKPPSEIKIFKDLSDVTLPEPITKISEKIRSRQILNVDSGKCCTCGRQVEEFSRAVEHKAIQVKEISKTEIESKKSEKPISGVEIPPIKIKSSLGSSESTQGTSKVQFYSHLNKIVTEREIPVNSYLEKTGPNSVEVIPDDDGIEQMREDARKRQIEAKTRGKSALEEEKIKKDYEEMMKKLPLLQRKERVSRISEDKPRYHMTQSRLEEAERKRQLEMENLYRPPPVTIPCRKYPDEFVKPNISPTIVKSESLRSIDLAEWSAEDDPKLFTAREVQRIVKAFTGRDPKERRKKLRELLDNLRVQKEELIEEMQKIPSDESMRELIEDLRGLDAPAGKKRRKVKESSDESSSSEVDVRKGRKGSKKSKVLVLQNTSTQTTPVIMEKPEQVDESTRKELKTPKVSTKPPKVSESSLENIEPSRKWSKADSKPSKLSSPCKCSHKFSDRTAEIEIPCKCKHSSEICQILIKVDDKRKSVEPKIEKKTKTVAVGTENSKLKWHDNFTKSTFSTSSTSYASPPEYSFPGKNKTSISRATTKKTILPQPEVITLIEKLLSMSRDSVENLSVSTVSSAPTPSQSVIEVEPNFPSLRLKSLVTNFHEIAKNLTFSPDVTNEIQHTLDEQSSRESLLNQYAKITESCTQRIQNLAEMIQKLRNEKESLLGASECVCDGSTGYLELPHGRKNEYKNGDSRGESQGSSFEEEVLKIMLDVRKENGEKDSNGKDRNGKTKKDIIAITKTLLDPESSNMEILNRLQNLRQVESSETSHPPAFVPFLSDIPKLPKFEPIPENRSTQSNHKRPPPSKGLMVAKRYNDISLMPHELSTIAETDSQLLSARKSPEDSKNGEKLKEVTETSLEESSGNASSSTRKSHEIIEKRPKQHPDMHPLSTTSSSLETPPITPKTDIKFQSLNHSSSSSSSTDSFEAMLRSIGMEWAIPTLHKTREALAMSTTSSTNISDEVQRKFPEIDMSKSGQVRTSTPVTGSKSTGKSGEMTFGEISSVSSVKKDSSEGSY